jgi:hypothetical protein
MNLYEKIFGPRKVEAVTETVSEPVVDVAAEVKKALDSFGLRLGYIEQQIQRLDSKVEAVAKSKSPNEQVQNQYYKEVTDLALALGPAVFKGAMKTCFTSPEETMVVNGHNSALAETLADATDALSNLDGIKQEQVALRGKTIELSSQLKNVESSLLKPRLPKKSSKAN